MPICVLHLDTVHNWILSTSRTRLHPVGKGHSVNASFALSYNPRLSWVHWVQVLLIVSTDINHNSRFSHFRWWLGIFWLHLFTSVTLSDSISIIQKGTFYDCYSLNGCTSKFYCVIEYQAFSGCDANEMIEIPKNVVKIGNEVFSWCPCLRTIFVPEGHEYSSYKFPVFSKIIHTNTTKLRCLIFRLTV